MANQWVWKNGAWVSVPGPPGIPYSAFVQQIIPVNITNPQTGQHLVYDGQTWINTVPDMDGGNF